MKKYIYLLNIILILSSCSVHPYKKIFKPKITYDEAIKIQESNLLVESNQATQILVYDFGFRGNDINIGKLIGIEKYDKNGNLIRQNKHYYIYNSENQIHMELSNTLSEVFDTVYHYYNSNNLISKKAYRPSSSKKFTTYTEYNNENNIIYEKFSGEDSLIYENIYEYDKNQKLISREELYYKTPKLNSKNIFEYNGNLQKNYAYNSSGKLIRSQDIIHDTNGNTISQILRNENDSIVYEIKDTFNNNNQKTKHEVIKPNSKLEVEEWVYNASGEVVSHSYKSTIHEFYYDKNNKVIKEVFLDRETKRRKGFRLHFYLNETQQKI